MIRSTNKGAYMTSEQPQEQPTIDPLLVRVDEAARLLSLSRSTIYEMMDAGELPSVRRGAARRIPVAALHAWIANQIDTSTTS
jgi:excisionase family DNA binding protein